MNEECSQDAVWSFHTYFFGEKCQEFAQEKLPYGHGWPSLCPEHAEEYRVWVRSRGGMTTANNWMYRDE